MATPSILSIRTSFSVHLQPVTWSDWHIECILTVCRKTRTKVITTPTHNKNKYNKDPIKLKVKTSKLPDARKMQVTKPLLVYVWHRADWSKRKER